VLACPIPRREAYPVNLKAYKCRRYRDTHAQSTELAEVVDFKTTRNGKNR
jgi:hypothetical protein